MNTWSSIVQYTFFLNCFIRRAHPIFIFIHSQKNKHCNFPKLQQLQKETIDLHLVRPAREVVLRMWRLRWSSRPMSLSIGGGTAPEHNYWKTTYMFWWTGHIISLWRANSSGRHINVSLSLWFVWKVANLFKLSELSECCKCSSWNIICSICDGTFLRQLFDGDLPRGNEQLFLKGWDDNESWRQRFLGNALTTVAMVAVGSTTTPPLPRLTSHYSKLGCVVLRWMGRCYGAQGESVLDIQLVSKSLISNKDI